MCTVIALNDGSNQYPSETHIYTASVSFSHALLLAERDASLDDQWKFHIFFSGRLLWAMEIINWACVDVIPTRDKLSNSNTAKACECDYQLVFWGPNALVILLLAAASRTHHPSFCALFTHAEWNLNILWRLFLHPAVAEAARFPARLTNCALSIQFYPIWEG